MTWPHLGDIRYIKFEILQIVSPSEDVKFSNVRGLYLRKYGVRSVAIPVVEFS